MFPACAIVPDNISYWVCFYRVSRITSCPCLWIDRKVKYIDEIHGLTSDILPMFTPNRMKKMNYQPHSLFLNTDFSNQPW